MRYLLFGMFLFFNYTKAYAQQADNTSGCNKSNLYYQSIVQLVQKKEVKIADTFYLEEDYKITDSILPVIENTNVRIIKLGKAALEKVKKNKRPFLLYTIRPLQFAGGDFWVTIVPLSLGYNPQTKKYQGLQGGHYNVHYLFDGKQFHFQQIMLAE